MNDILKQIKPGKNYPYRVEVTEPDGMKIVFNLNSFYCGMYCAIYVGANQMPQQTGDHNNKTFVAQLKRDLKKAITRGATVEISGIRDCKLTP